MKVIKVKVLKSIDKETTQPINPPVRKPVMCVLLTLIGLICGYVGFMVGQLLGLVFVLVGVTFALAGIIQIIGVSECVCPDCCSKGNIYRYAKNYKCKTCGKTSIVTENSTD